MELFYRLNPKKMQRYQPFLLARLRQKKDDFSEIGWTNGLYVGRAIGSVFPKGKKYPNEPMQLYNVPEEEPISDAERFKAFAMAFNIAHEDKFVDPLEKAIMESLENEHTTTDLGSADITETPDISAE